MTSIAPGTHAEAEKLLYLGRERLREGLVIQALDYLRQAITLRPDLHEAHFLLGKTFTQIDQKQDAIVCYQKAVELDPKRYEYHYSLGGLFMQLGNFVQAAEHYRIVLSLQPNHIECYNALGIALAQQRNFREAAECYQKAIALNPGYIDAYNSLGLLLMQLGDASSAEQCLRIALQLRGSTRQDLPSGKVMGGACAWQLRLNLGRALDFQGNLEAAIDSYRQAIAESPETALLHINLALDLLATGQLLEGWKEYEWRWKSTGNEIIPRQFSRPQWTGQPLHGESILLHAEQGYGDTIQFARYAQLVAEKGGKVILEVQPRLHRLLQTVPGAYQVISKGDPLPDFSWHCPFMSLPLASGTTMESIPAFSSYLRPSDQETSAAPHTMAGEGLRVGLAWAGNMKSTQDIYRSISLAQLSPLSAVSGVSFCSLQVGEAANQISEVYEQFPITDACSHYTDFADTAAVIASLDLVITIDTSIAHLAGALGIPVWIMLPLNRTDWRWFLNRDDSPWYPSARLFRQETTGDWNSVVLRVKAELESLMKSRASQK